MKEHILSIWLDLYDGEKILTSLLVMNEEEFEHILNNIYEPQKERLNKAIEDGWSDISFGVYRIKKTYFINRIWNSLSEGWEDWNEDLDLKSAHQEVENEFPQIETERENYFILREKLFAATLKEGEILWKRWIKKQKEKYEI